MYREKLIRSEFGKIHEINIGKIKLYILRFYVSRLFSTMKITFSYNLANILASWFLTFWVLIIFRT